MKTLNTQLILLVAALGLSAIGCSKSGGGFDAGTTVVTAGTGLDYNVAPLLPAPSGMDGSTTSTVSTFTPVSTAELASYAGHPVNNPTNFNITISLHNADGAGHYAGEVRLAYDDYGVHREGVFIANDGYNSDFESYGTARDVGVPTSAYNYWFNLGGKTVFSGFFQDSYGAVVLVIDNAQSLNQGDGQGGTTISGQIWYRNFANSYATQGPERQCWFIYDGPYNCRSNTVITKSGLYPQDSYRKLGDFSGVLMSSAFQ